MKYILLLIIPFNFCLGQTNNELKKADEIFDKAMEVLESPDYEKSLPYFEEAALIYKKNNDWAKYINSQNFKGKILIEQQKYKEALSVSLSLLHEAQHINPNDIMLGKLYGTIALAYDYSNVFDSALKYHHKALKIWGNYKHEGDSLTSTLMNLGVIHNLTGQNDSSIYYAKRAVEFIKKSPEPDGLTLAKIYNNIGNIYSDTHKYELALEFYKRSIDTHDQYSDEIGMDNVMFNWNSGNVYLAKGNFNTAQSHYENALILIDSISSQSYAKGVIYQNLAELHRQKGEIELSLEYSAKAETILTSVFGDQNSYNFVGVFNTQGLCFFEKKDYESAEKYFKKLIGLVEQSKNHPDVIAVYVNMGELYSVTGDYQKALPYFEKCLKISQESFEADNDYTAMAYNNIARVYQKLEDFDKTKDYYQKAIKVSLLNTGKHLPQFYHGQASLYEEIGKLDSSIYFLKQSIRANISGFETSKESGPPLDSRSLFGGLSKLSQLEEKLYAKSNNANEYNRALETYKAFDEYVKKYSQSYILESDKIELLSEISTTYKNAVSLCHQLFQKTNDKSYLYDAFHFSQSIRSIVLTEAITSSNSKKYLGIPDSLINKEKNLKTDISFYQTQIKTMEIEQDSNDYELLKDYKNTLFDTKRSLERTLKEYETKYPNYFELRHNQKPLNTASILDQIKDRDALIQYTITDDAVYIFLLSNGKLSLEKVDLPQDFDQMIKVNKLDEIVNNVRSYQLLIKPIASLIKGKNLTIIPDGVLWNINFDLLLKEKPESNNPKEFPYLFKEHPISYAYSIPLIFRNKVKKLRDKKPLLAFSFGETDQIDKQFSLRASTPSGEELPGSRAELKAISNFIDGDYFFGKFASEKQFKENAANYQILHLAIHGETDDKKPENSRLYFFTKGDTIEDGQLHAFELYNMDIGADLAVLSACNTGSGEIVVGEGIMSLGRAFAYAGVNSLLLTRWGVSDTLLQR